MTTTNPTGSKRRALTPDELHTIHVAIRDAQDTPDLRNAALGALYTALLADTGNSLHEMLEAGQLKASDYAIPTSQWQAILAAATRRAEAWGTAAQIGLDLAINLMPSHYHDPDAPTPDLPLPDYRPLSHRLTLSREAVDVIAACETHLSRLRTFYGQASATYQTALHSWHRNLAGLFTMNTGADTHITRDGDLSLFVRTGSGLVYALIFHGATRRCTDPQCEALLDDDGAARPRHSSASVLKHDHTPSYPVGAPRPGDWSFHS